MFSNSLELMVGKCYKEARERHLKYMGVEQLLYYLLDDPDIHSFVEVCGANVSALKKSLQAHIGKTVELLPKNSEADTTPTVEFQRVLQRAVYHVQSSGRREVVPFNCLVAVFGENDSYACGLLKKKNIERLDAVNYFLTGEVGRSKPSLESKIERIAETALELSSAPKTPASGLRIFISYNHNDKACLDRLLVHLRPLQRENKIDPWSDKRIRPGGKWKEEISDNISDAAVAVLLLSADFLASDFIVENELPPLLINAESHGTRILPVIIKPCGFTRDRLLSSFQCINDPKHPLLGLCEIDQEHLYEEIASEIYEELKSRASYLS